MRAAVDFDDVERLEASARTPKAHRQAAATLTVWAEERHPDDEAEPAELLSAAAWHLDQAGDTEAALDLHRRAVTAQGTTTPDARCMLAAALLEAGRPDEALQVAEDLRRSHPRIGDIAGMAEVYELAGDLRQAHRWVAIGVNRLGLTAETADLDDFDIVVLLTVRRKVRHDLGYPPDDLDEIEF